MLRAKKPSLIEKRLKCFLYGVAGSGKTTAAIQFPKPYLIDCERGAENEQYIDHLEKNGGVIFQSTSFDEIVDEVKGLLCEKHEYKTLIIDPFTVIYNNLIDMVALKTGTDFGRHYSEAAKHVKRLFDLLLRLDMNVILTSHAKTEYGKDMTVLGQTFDCYKKSDYLFDLVIEIQKRGKSRIGIVKKSRIRTFDELEQFEFSYPAIAKKYGIDIIEKESIPQELPNESEVSELKHLLDVFHVSQDIIDKALSKSSASCIEEMPKENVLKWIGALKNKILNQKEVTMVVARNPELSLSVNIGE